MTKEDRACEAASGYPQCRGNQGIPGSKSDEIEIKRIVTLDKGDMKSQVVCSLPGMLWIRDAYERQLEGLCFDLFPVTNLGEGIVGWEDQDDPEMPLNFSKKRKWIWVGLLLVVTLLTPFAPSILSPAITQLDSEFGNDNSIVGSMTVSIYLLGYVLGPIFIAPLSEIYGRKPVLGVANVIFCLWQIGCALAPNIETLIVSRFFSGVGGAGCLTLGGSIIGDLFRPDQRGFAMGMWNIGPLIGPTVGPLIGGFLAESIGWRYEFWIVLVAATIVTVLIQVLNEETSHKVIIQRKTARLRRLLGRSDLKSRYDDSDDRNKTRILLASLTRPLKMLILCPIVFFLSLYIAFVFGVVYLLYTTIPTVFEETYKFETRLTGLVYLSLGLGNVLGWLANGGVFEPEMRLLTSVPFGICLPITLFWYGWSTFYATHWVSPILSLIPYGFGIVGLFLPITTYLVDSYPMYAASAVAANIVLRRFICIVMIPFPVVMYKFGARLRTTERF
ncbi:MFS general substrate transporter [Hypoxylon trugodes]|uniref:MFS general substrate transporter n=1 Tax=Hypoxylon trugodes TaxID=326681 RepID=UPI0021937023|nr:MFS general substrate transporter [Hypoxylon trugodes]KAI1390702.1 MFS general substrate transporter [Hypoxylon trugodes]